MIKDSILPYRQGVNAIIVDKGNLFLVIQLIEYQSDEWKFVGGGLEGNESLLNGALREIEEEVNILSQDLYFLGESQYVQKYDFPATMQNEIKNKYRGQEKHQLVFRYTGSKENIILQKEEIRKIAWVPASELKNYLIFPNQYNNASLIIQEFELANMTDSFSISISASSNP